MRRGDICWAELIPRSGSEQTRRRPVLVLAHDGFNRVPGWRSVIVVPLTTSSRQASRGPTAVPIPRGEGGLAQASTALCHQVTTLDRGKLAEFIGMLPDTRMAEIEQGLKAALDLS